MCLAVPAKIIELRRGRALADMHGNQVPVATALVPDVEVGDWVLVHAGFAIKRLEESEAKETYAILEDVARSSPEALAVLSTTEPPQGATSGKGRGS